MRYFIEFAYNGKNYCGWQSQPNAITIQETLEKIISTILNQKIALVGAGRTDSGVHAKQMFAHFDCDKLLTSHFIHKANSFLPKDIAIYNLFEATNQAHARFDAIQRSYEYHINSQKNPFLTDYAYYFPFKLNLDLMNTACQILFEHTDFQCFSKSKTDVKTYNCIINEAHWVKENDVLIFHISADRFLRNMVRAIVGTLLKIGQEKINLNDFRKIIESKNRSQAGFSVPGHGLFLTKVLYPKELLNVIE